MLSVSLYLVQLGNICRDDRESFSGDPLARCLEGSGMTTDESPTQTMVILIDPSLVVAYGSENKLLTKELYLVIHLNK